MPQNGIRMEGVIALAKGLAKNPGMQYIDLQDNAFSVDGALSGIEAWTEALKSWPELHTLNLSDCLISTEGEVPELVKALVKGSNPKLKTLQLQNNNFKSDTFGLLAGSISTTLKNIMRLELQWNEVDEDDEHVETLRDSLKQRGGKLIATDDDEEEDEEEKAEEEGEEEEEIKHSAPIVAEAIREEEKEPTKTNDDATDDLISKLSQVKI